MRVSSHFDSGNIDVIDDKDQANVRVNINVDAHAEHFQWFHFRVSGLTKSALVVNIENAEAASYKSGWPGYRACASYDGKNWFRVDTAYTGGQLKIQFVPEHTSVYLAYFAPYSLTRHQQLVGFAQSRPGVTCEVLGSTLDGRDLDLITLGDGDVPVWFIARQHPGESMAEWLMEGLIHRLCDPADALATKLRKAATFYLVPNMNPDGSFRGHLRVNAAGANLNREWETPTMERSPEVKLVRDRMDQTGLRFCLDVHGDEGLPYNFIAGSDGVEGLPENVRKARDDYEYVLEKACPDFQRVHGYPKAPLGKANMTMATNQLANRFSALCMTLEQPFKDNDDNPLPDEGWSPRRAKLLGRAQLDALATALNTL